ncbi:hypothetical protein Hanom_Chr07g00621051 [Helianthus anomalus]
MFNVFYYVTYTGGFYSFKSHTADIHYWSESEGVPKVAVSIPFTDLEWYKTLTRNPTPIIQLEEKALVAAGKGYSLMNVFDPKVAGEMAMAALPVGKPKRNERIRDKFLHPSSESMGAYTNVILGALEDKTDLDTAPTREEAILLSSEESTSSSHGLIHHSPCADPQQRPGRDPTIGGVSTPPVVDPITVAAGPKWRETRSKAEERGTN